MINNILVPVDGSGHSKKALELACDLASKYNAAIRLLFVTFSPTGSQTMVLGGASVTVAASRRELEKAGGEVIEAAKKIAGDYGCKELATEIAEGAPAQRILESAKKNNADMIVMGSRGLSDAAGLLMGSVSHKVSHLAKCTCVTVH